MKRKLLKIGKSLIVYIVIVMIFLSNISYAYSQEEVGNAVAGFAKHVVDTYGDNGTGSVKYRQCVGDKFDSPSARGGESGHCRTDNPIWSPSEYQWDDQYIYFDCSSFATGCYHYVTGIIQTAWATGDSSSGLLDSPSDMTGSLEKIHWDKQLSSLKNGDLMVYDGHAWIYSGDGQTSENGSKHNSWDTYNGQDIYIWRISESGASNLTSLNTEFSTGSTSSSSSSTVDFSNFYFNGIPDGKYSLASTSIWNKIIEFLSQIADYLIGLLTYLLRIPFIGWTAIFDNLLNWTANSINKTTTETDDTMGINSVEVEGADDSDRLTLDGLLYNTYDLFNINIFDI